MLWYSGQTSPGIEQNSIRRLELFNGSLENTFKMETTRQQLLTPIKEEMKATERVSPFLGFVAPVRTLALLTHIRSIG